MATVIRLTRQGAKKRPYYHIVVTNSRNARNSGNILERVGFYNPMVSKESADRIKFDADKIKAWLAKGAKPSDRVYKFLANAGLLPKKEIPVQTKKNQPSEKTMMKIKDREEKLKKAAEAKAAAEAEAKAAETPAVETPAEEAPAETPIETPAETPAAEETPAEAPVTETAAE